MPHPRHGLLSFPPDVFGTLGFLLLVPLPHVNGIMFLAIYWKGLLLAMISSQFFFLNKITIRQFGRRVFCSPEALEELLDMNQYPFQLADAGPQGTSPGSAVTTEKNQRLLIIQQLKPWRSESKSTHFVRVVWKAASQPWGLELPLSTRVFPSSQNAGGNKKIIISPSERSSHALHGVKTRWSIMLWNLQSEEEAMLWYRIWIHSDTKGVAKPTCCGSFPCQPFGKTVQQFLKGWNSRCLLQQFYSWGYTKRHGSRHPWKNE